MPGPRPASSLLPATSTGNQRIAISGHAPLLLVNNQMEVINMHVLQPGTWQEALEMRAAWPEAVPMAGATHLMSRPRLWFGHPAALLDLSRLSELRAWSWQANALWVGAGATYAEVAAGLSSEVPALADALGQAGPPQVRNRATVGGALAAALPSGSCHSPLLAVRATVEAASVRGIRLIPITEFYRGPQCSMLASDELIRGVLIPRHTGTQRYLQVSTRRAMAPSIGSFAVAVTTEAGSLRIGTGVGGGQVPVPARRAELFLGDWLNAAGPRVHDLEIPEHVVREFGDLAAAAPSPAADSPVPPGYVRRAVEVLARRALLQCWSSYQGLACGSR